MDEMNALEKVIARFKDHGLSRWTTLRIVKEMYRHSKLCRNKPIIDNDYEGNDPRQ